MTFEYTIAFFWLSSIALVCVGPLGWVVGLLSLTLGLKLLVTGLVFMFITFILVNWYYL